VHVRPRVIFPGWCGDVKISAAEFDELIGHSVAVTDAVGSCFAPEPIATYPDAKVALNVRMDLDAWHHSAVKTLLDEVERSWVVWSLKWFRRWNSGWCIYTIISLSDVCLEALEALWGTGWCRMASGYIVSIAL
jgi:hypothetical protein